MRILLLNQYYPPDTSATARVAEQLATGLAQTHQVTVLAGRPSYAPTEWLPYQLWSRTVHGSLMIERVGSCAFPRSPMWKRFANYLTYFALAFPRAVTLRADLVIAMTDPPMAGIFGALIAWLTRRPVIHNIRDLYPDYVIARGIVRDQGWVTVWRWAHQWALRRAARVVALGEDMRDRLIAQGLCPERVVVIHGGDPLPPAASSTNGAVVAELRHGFPFVVMHAGTLGFSGAWETILEAARRLRDDAVGFVFVGDGVARSQVEAQADGEPNIRLVPFRPAPEQAHVLAAADVHLVTLRRGLEGVALPGKLYAILAAGRPILAVAPQTSDLARLVRDLGCGLVADPDDPASVAQAIRQLTRDPARLQAMGRQAREASRAFTPARYLEQFQQVVQACSPR